MSALELKKTSPLLQKSYILGSGSPRRKELLAGLDIDFKVVNLNVNEDFDSNIPTSTIPSMLAERKSKAYGFLKTNEVLITADTIVLLKGAVINKPQDLNEAKCMLQTLSGTEHTVITGVCIRSSEAIKSFSCSTTVHFDVLSDAEIDYYLLHYAPLDKAGSYGIQDYIGYIGVSRIEGCFYNVMGLPLNKLYKELCAF